MSTTRLLQLRFNSRVGRWFTLKKVMNAIGREYKITLDINPVNSLIFDSSNLHPEYDGDGHKLSISRDPINYAKTCSYTPA